MKTVYNKTRLIVDHTYRQHVPPEVRHNIHTVDTLPCKACGGDTGVDTLSTKYEGEHANVKAAVTCKSCGKQYWIQQIMEGTTHHAETTLRDIAIVEWNKHYGAERV